MSSLTVYDVQSEPLDKGKGKGRAQDPTERTPLLDRPSQSSNATLGDDTPARATSRRRLRARLTSVFLVSLSFCILGFAILALLAWSYAAQASKVSPDEILHNALVFRGPSRVDVLNITSGGGIWVNVSGSMGMDAGAVIGVNSDPSGDGLLQHVWKSLGRWGVRRLDRVSIHMSTINITSANDPSAILASVGVPPMEVSLTANPPPDKSWLTPVSIPVLILPTSNTSALIHFVRDAWRRGFLSIRADMDRALVHGGSLNENSWRDKLHGEISNIQTALRMTIPSIPGFPHPGHNLPFPSISELITLQSFSVSSEENKLALRARATMIDPAPPTFNLTSPSMPFTVFIPSDNLSSRSLIPVASIRSSPFTLTHPNITLLISGTVLPLPASSTNTLSSLVSRFLSGQPNSILVSSPLLPEFYIDTMFPAPNPPPQILRNVTIRDMKIKPGNTFLASGIIFARIVLPKGVHVRVNVHRVLPDVLIFDGEVPNSTFVSFKPPSLPDPLPERAFGHIRPDDWLDALSVADEPQEDEGATYIVTAKIVDVPLQVLPGRQKEFSNFVSKVVFGTDGAIAGILGSAAVGVEVEGLPYNGPGNPREMEFSGLPFQGSVRIGKKGLFSDTPMSTLKSFISNEMP